MAGRFLERKGSDHALIPTENHHVKVNGREEQEEIGNIPFFCTIDVSDF